MSLVTCLALKDAAVHGGQCSPAVLPWKMRQRVIPVMMRDQSWCPVSIGGLPGMKMPSYTAQARHSRSSTSVKSTRGYMLPRVLQCFLAQLCCFMQQSDVKVKIWHRASCKGMSLPFSGHKACPSLNHM